MPPKDDAHVIRNAEVKEEAPKRNVAQKNDAIKAVLDFLKGYNFRDYEPLNFRDGILACATYEFCSVNKDIYPEQKNIPGARFPSNRIVAEYSLEISNKVLNFEKELKGPAEVIGKFLSALLKQIKEDELFHVYQKLKVPVRNGDMDAAIILGAFLKEKGLKAAELEQHTPPGLMEVLEKTVDTMMNEDATQARLTQLEEIHKIDGLNFDFLANKIKNYKSKLNSEIEELLKSGIKASLNQGILSKGLKSAFNRLGLGADHLKKARVLVEAFKAVAAFDDLTIQSIFSMDRQKLRGNFDRELRQIATPSGGSP